MLASKSEALASNYGESSTTAETSFGAEGATAVESSSAGVLAGQSDLLSEVSSVVKETANISKSLVGAGEGAGAGDIAGEEAVAGALDEVPIIGIIGLLVGGGLAIGASLKKPKFSPPVDNVNASYQVGI